MIDLLFGVLLTIGFFLWLAHKQPRRKKQAQPPPPCLIMDEPFWWRMSLDEYVRWVQAGQPDEQEWAKAQQNSALRDDGLSGLLRFPTRDHQ